MIKLLSWLVLLVEIASFDSFNRNLSSMFSPRWVAKPQLSSHDPTNWPHILSGAFNYTKDCFETFPYRSTSPSILTSQPTSFVWCSVKEYSSSSEKSKNISQMNISRIKSFLERFRCQDLDTVMPRWKAKLRRFVINFFN